MENPKQYTLIQVLEILAETNPEGAAILPPELVRDLVSELSRLYELEQLVDHSLDGLSLSVGALDVLESRAERPPITKQDVRDVGWGGWSPGDPDQSERVTADIIRAKKNGKKTKKTG